VESATDFVRRGNWQRRFRLRKLALKNYARATELDSGNTLAWESRGNLAASLDRHEEASSSFRHLAELEPDNADAWRGRARALRILEVYDDACIASANAVFYGARNPDNWLERAECLRVAGDRPEDTLTAALHALSLASTSTEGWSDNWAQCSLLAGTALLSLQRFEEAIDAFDGAINLQRRPFLAWLGKGYALQGLGRSAEAVEAFHRARRLAYGSDAPNVPESPLAAVRAGFTPIARDFWTERRKLLIPSLAYAAGLVVWSVNAHRNDLGAQASADLDYLVAGIVPGLIFLALLGVVLFLMAAPAWTSEWMSQRRPDVGGYVMLGALIAWFALVFLTPGENGEFDIALVVVSIFLMIAPFFLTPIGRGWRLIWTLAVVVGSLIAVVLVFSFYANNIYPRLPQSLGGGLPRCAHVDINTASISQQTLAGLLPADGGRTDGSTSGTARSDPQIRSVDVDILFARDDVLFVRRRDEAEAGGSKSQAEGSESQAEEANPTHELRGDVVRAVVAC
jgi:tetratricopeptide (TPR) repeat protein